MTTQNTCNKIREIAVAHGNIDQHYVFPVQVAFTQQLSLTLGKIVDIVHQFDIDTIISSTEYQIKCLFYDVSEPISFIISMCSISSMNNDEVVLEIQQRNDNYEAFVQRCHLLVQSLLSANIIMKTDSCREFHVKNHLYLPGLSTRDIRDTKETKDTNDFTSLIKACCSTSQTSNAAWYQLARTAASSCSSCAVTIVTEAKSLLIQALSHPDEVRHLSALIIICHAAKLFPAVLQWPQLFSIVNEMWNTYHMKLTHSHRKNRGTFFPHVVRYISCWFYLFHIHSHVNDETEQRVILNQVISELKQINDLKTRSYWII